MADTLDPDLIAHFERALGRPAIDALRARELVRWVDAGPVGPIDDTVLRRRVAGAVHGLALGDALAAEVQSMQPSGGVLDLERWGATAATESDAVTAATQTFVLAAESWLAAGGAGPAALSDALLQRRSGLRSPGRALRLASQRRDHGAAWFDAAVDSFGDAALPRAVAAGLAHARRPGLAAYAGSFDAAVTHASRSAALCSATLAAVVVAAIHGSDVDDWATTVRRVVASVDHGATRDLLLGAVADPRRAPLPLNAIGPEALPSLAVAIWSQHGTDAIDVLHTAVAASRANRSAVVVAGALFGAIHGVEALPPRHRSVEGAPLYDVLVDRLLAFDPGAGHRADRHAAASTDGGRPGADIWFLIDRSGSMGSLTDDVVTGFDRFIEEQQRIGGDATVTVVQFDDEAPHDVVVDARPLDGVGSLRGRFEPRGLTPLYDAIGALLDRAESRGGHDQDQLVVVFTDGLENASRRWSRAQLFRRIARLRERGWTFVFLGANQDSYHTGSGLSVAAGNVSNFDADRPGVAATYRGLSRTVGAWRGKDRDARRRDIDRFWGDVKEPEQR